MDHVLLGDLFRSAQAYHGALAQYAAALRACDDIETPAQTIIGTALRYRVALDRVLGEADAQSVALVASRGRLKRLRAMLASTSRRYNRGKPLIR